MSEHVNVSVSGVFACVCVHLHAYTVGGSRRSDHVEMGKSASYEHERNQREHEMSARARAPMPVMPASRVGGARARVPARPVG